MYINSFSSEEIQVINAFLNAKQQPSFGDDLIHFLNQISKPNGDPLGLLDSTEIGLLGQIIELDSDNRYAGLCFPSSRNPCETPEVLNSLYRDQLNKDRDQYSEFEFNAMCEQHLLECKSLVPCYAVLMYTTNITGIFDLLLLNQHKQPIAITMMKLKCL